MLLGAIILLSTSCTVNVAHAFASSIGVGVMLSCLCVVRCDAGAVFALFSASILFWQRQLNCSGVLLSAVCTIECPLIVVIALVGLMSSCAISAGLDF